MMEEGFGDQTYTRREEPPPPAATPIVETTAQSPLPTAIDPRSSTGKMEPPPQVPQMPQGKRLSLAVINGPDAGTVFR
ncbi:MAG: hypothetical protein ABIP63_06445, partial [Thermoanaerobaculia bacterium]